MVKSRQRWAKWGVGVVTLFDWLLYGITFVVAVAMVLAYFAPYVHPAKIYWFAFLGLAAPFIYIANALLDGALAESGVVVVGGVCARIGACGQIFSSPME